jgi:hypothetical protein
MLIRLALMDAVGNAALPPWSNKALAVLATQC